MTITRRQLLGTMAGLGALAACPAMAKDTERLSGRAFGTSWSILLPDGGADDLVHAVPALFERIDRALSPFRPDSEISAFNRAGAGALPVGPDFARVTAEALRLAGLSQGAFDPTIGPLVGRYGFGPIHGERQGDFTALSCAPSSIAKTRAALTLDLCGIAKGYALDLLAAELRQTARDNFLIDIGGEVLAAGLGPHQRPWRLGIADPLSGGLHTRFAATDLAIATSGDAINAYEVAGRRYSHTIDPKTGEPVRNALASVSVVHPSAMTADGLATALVVLGPQAGPAFAERHDLAALFLLRTGQNRLDAIASPAFTAFAEA